ncbi:hypothetical protein LZ32DRAFT_63261 [Colletotrichum eremochloae]|nr:hypothetical protein LZ32DRAFT_63261 [Colletotrichum eremochloae]
MLSRKLFQRTRKKWLTRRKGQLGVGPYPLLSLFRFPLACSRVVLGKCWKEKKKPLSPSFFYARFGLRIQPTLCRKVGNGLFLKSSTLLLQYLVFKERKKKTTVSSTMALGDDVTPGPALAGRLLRALGKPLQQRSYYYHHSYRRPGVSASESDAIALELVSWPSSPTATERMTSITTTTDDNTTYELDSCECDFPQTIKRRRCSQSCLGNLQGHTRANSLDSTTTSSSAASLASSLSPTSSSRLGKFGQTESTTTDRNAKLIEARRRKESTELWREYW